MKKTIPLIFGIFVLSACAFILFNEFSDKSLESLEYEAIRVESYDSSMMNDTDSMKMMALDESGYVEGVEQKVIKTGTLSMHMKNVQDGVDAIKMKIEEMGGQLSNTNLIRYSNSYRATMTVQVPSAQFDAAIEILKEMALYVSSEYTNADNITEAYMDLEARLNNLKEEESQYLLILDKAVTVEEILQVTDYLSNVRYEIESIEGQLKYYDNNVDYSTISITLTEDESLEAVQESWRPLSTFNEAISDWMIFLQKFLDFGIYTLIFGWPILLIVLIHFVWKRSHSKKRK